jgi:hypothetical protein
MLVPFWNLFVLMGSPGGYWKSRRKQLDLINLAFLKHRRRRGASVNDSSHRESKLRERIAAANHSGVFIGAR